jgi:hypothetical protein
VVSLVPENFVILIAFEICEPINRALPENFRPTLHKILVGALMQNVRGVPLTCPGSIACLRNSVVNKPHTGESTQ